MFGQEDMTAEEEKLEEQAAAVAASSAGPKPDMKRRQSSYGLKEGRSAMTPSQVALSARVATNLSFVCDLVCTSKLASYGFHV